MSDALGGDLRQNRAMDADAERIPLPESLVLAVGSVAIASADLEEALRRVVGSLCNADVMDGTALLFEGQSMDWLISNGKLLASDEHLSRYRRGDGDLPELFRKAEQLRGDRNTVIHGQWYAQCSYDPEDAALMCSPHSVNTYAQAGLVCHVERSRYRKFSKEEAWAVAEVVNLASEMNWLSDRLYSYVKYIDRAWQRLDPHEDFPSPASS